MQIIFIRDLRVEAIIGVHAWERQVKQLLCLNLEFSYDTEQAIAHDDVAFAIDYAAVIEQIIHFIHTHPVHLIETLAHQVADLLMQAYPIQWLRLTLAKPAVLPQTKEVGVVVERRSVEVA